jgi:hypothetical protein
MYMNYVIMLDITIELVIVHAVQSFMPPNVV